MSAGEDLNRRYHELCGWKVEQRGGYEHCQYFFLIDEKGEPRSKPNEGCHSSSLWLAAPPLHLDANLAIAEADRVFVLPACKKPDYTLYRGVGGWGLDSAVLNSHPFGETFCIAILKALIAAKERT